MTARSIAEFATHLSTAGLNAIGALSPEEYDARVPAAWQTAQLYSDARQWLVVGSGGTALFDAYEASALASGGSPDPLDRFVRARVNGACREAQGARVFHYDDVRGGAFADFVALGRACGLGAQGALGLAMHPGFGPWWSIRVLIGVPFEFDVARPAAFESPCLGCAAPCITACRGAAVHGPSGPFDASACAATRAREPACAERCDARRACPAGADAAYSAAAEAHHMRAALAWLASAPKSS